MFLCVFANLPLHPLHQRHLIRRGGDVEGGGPALVDAPLDAVHRVLLLHLHRVTQTQRPEEQVLVLLHMQKNKNKTHTLNYFIYLTNVTTYFTV